MEAYDHSVLDQSARLEIWIRLMRTHSMCWANFLANCGLAIHGFVLRSVCKIKATSAIRNPYSQAFDRHSFKRLR
ncbi:UNVERIFIED_CONTAM: hypothetical protein GTU68_037680 [Idotea baltica]|nr:hypothetical protein [Idotea baltica]